MGETPIADNILTLSRNFRFQLYLCTELYGSRPSPVDLGSHCNEHAVCIRLYASQRERSSTTDHEAATETWQRKNRHLQEHDQTGFRDAWMEVDADYADRIRM
jgi:hypothetical protein